MDLTSLENKVDELLGMVINEEPRADAMVEELTELLLLVATCKSDCRECSRVLRSAVHLLSQEGRI